MLQIFAFALGALALAVTFLVPGIEGWGPFFALLLGGGVHLTWIVRRENREARFEASPRRAA